MSTLSAKFRPSLTAGEIEYLITVLQHAPSCEHRDNVLSVLRKFHLKAVHGIVSPSHVAAPRVSLVDSLGFGGTDSGRTVFKDDDINILLNAYINTPAVLSPAQLTRVQHHRYTNDMMTPEEEQAYESSSTGSLMRHN